MQLAKLFILFLLASFGTAHAVSWNSQSDFYWNVANGKVSVFPGQGVGNVWTKAETGSSALGATVARSRALALGGATAEAKALFTPAGIAKGLLNPASAAVTLVGAALINQALDEACLRVFGGSMEISPGGQWEECHKTTQTVMVWRAGGPAPYAQGDGSSAIAAEMDWISKVNAANPAQITSHVSCVQQSATNYLCKSTWVRVPFDGNNFSYEHQVTASPGTASVTDGWMPASQDKAIANLTPVLEQWSQADFTAGRQAGQGDLQQVLDSLMKSGNSVEVESVSTSGPATSPAGDTTSTASDGTVTTTHNQYNYNYDNSNKSQSVITVTQTTVNNVTNNQGQTTTTTTTSDKPAPDPCGAPGQSPCAVKVDETGTPTATDTKYDSKADSLGQQKSDGLNTIKAAPSALTAVLSTFTDFFQAPPFVPCEPITFPNAPAFLGGQPMGQADACPVVDNVRTVMGYIWAITALYLMLGMVSKSLMRA